MLQPSIVYIKFSLINGLLLDNMFTEISSSFELRFFFSLKEFIKIYLNPLTFEFNDDLTSMRVKKSLII